MKILIGLLRVIALLIGAVFALGGGICTMTNVPSSIFALESGNFSALPLLLLWTAISVAVLMLGVYLVRFGMGRKTSAPPEPPTDNQL